MIDYETDIFNDILTEFRQVYPASEVEVASETVKKPAFLPFVSIEEIGNYSDLGTADQDNGDRVAVITYDVNVYTNDITGKKSRAKAILDVIDRSFVSRNFRRVQRDIVPNLADATVYRIMGRYRAKIDEDGKLYRR